MSLVKKFSNSYVDNHSKEYYDFHFKSSVYFYESRNHDIQDDSKRSVNITTTTSTVIMYIIIIFSSNNYIVNKYS